MQHSRSVDDSPTAHDINRQLAEDQSHVTRGEFRALRNDVHEIKTALLGEMKEGNGIIAQHHEMRRKVATITRLAWFAALGILTAIGTLAWTTMTAKHP